MSATKRKRKPMTATATPATPAAPSIQITIRLDPAVLDDADVLIPALTERTGLPATRVDVLRAALVRGLRAMKREQENAIAD
jgi:hypothetical protein